MTGLNKQTLTLNFGQGVDSKTDEKLVQPGKLLLLENGVFHKAGRIDKRNGYSLLSSQTIDGSTLTTGSALATFKNEVLQYNKQKLYSFSEGSEKWLDKGSAISAILQTKQIINNTAQQTACDSAMTSGIGIYAWEDSRGGVRGTIYDETTGTTIVNDMLLNATATNVRCMAFKGFLFVFYVNAGNLIGRKVTPSTPTAFGAELTVTNDINTTSKLFDCAIVKTARMFTISAVQGANQLKIVFLDENLTVLSGALAPVFLNELAENSLAVVQGPLVEYFVAYHNNTDGLKAFSMNNGGSYLVAPLVVDATTTPIAQNIAGYMKRDKSGVQFYYEVHSAQTYNTLIKQFVLTTAGSVTGLSIFMRSVGLWSKAFSYNDPNDSVERGYVGIVHSSSLQSTYFIVRNDGVICAKMQPNLAAGLSTRPILQNVNNIGSGNLFAFSVLNKTRLIVEESVLLSQIGVARTEIDFNSQEAFNFAELGQNLHIVGGVLSMYDGVSVVEHGFHLYPENITSALSGGAGAIPDGAYLYAVVYEWKDNVGNIHRSAPSVPFTVTVAGGPKDIILTIPTLRLTQKTGIRTNVVLQVYRSVKDGTILHRVTSITSPTFNNPAVDTVTFTDTVLDATLLSNDILYTTGGELDNLSAPSCTYIAVFKNRIFLAGLEDQTAIWYSKINAIGAPVEFAGELTLNIDPQGRGITALGVLDDKVIFFKKDRFYITYGDGPNNNGELGEFAQPQFVTADAGCISSRSIVRVPQGIMFKSQKGIYQLNSSLGVEYVGAEVEDFNQLTVTSAVLKSDVNQVRFTTLDGVALIYDYYFKQWSTFTNHKATDSLIWNNKFVILRTDGNVYFENPDVFTDNFVAYSMRIMTAWLAFDSVTGFQRIYDLAFLGEYKSPHILRCKIGYDFSPAFAPPIIFTPDTDIPITHYGDDATYGESAVYGGDNSSYRWKASLTQQKCQAIRFLFEDLVSAGTEGSQESFTITSIGLQIGTKGHLGRFKGSQSIGTQGGV